MIKRIFLFLGVVLAFGLGIALASWYFTDKAKESTQANATVLLEQIKQVRKLVTVEGAFSEIYDEKNIRSFTIYLPMPSVWSFSKEAILKVTGKVLVGYNLREIALTLDSTNQKLILSNLPEPEILSIDHELEYKNLEESYFNAFTPEDYTRISKNAKAVLAQKAKESGLLQKAAIEGNQMIEVMRAMAAAAGWELEVENSAKITVPEIEEGLLE
jgi:hypothetical protein